MSEELYQKAILRLAGAAVGHGRLTGACCTGREANAMCGDIVTFDVRVDGAGRVAELATDIKGCVLVQASASLLAQTVKGQTRTAITNLKNHVNRMLAGGDSVEGIWKDYEVFRPAMAYRSRHSCVLLPIEALEKALLNCASIAR
jgi:NifU-like protein involved in Fe-S cluster formation